MNKSIDILKSIYKPYRYTIMGKTTLLETTSGSFIIKPKNKNINELYSYLISRGFDSFPNLVDSSRSDVNVFEYIKDIDTPFPQKYDDMIDLVSTLHNKTSYFKEVSEDNYKEIYENIDSNITYLKNYYNTFYEKSFPDIYMSPSTYLFMRNFSKIDAALDFCKNALLNWYEMVKNEQKSRVSVVHNNLEINHFIKNSKDYLISWDNYKIDTPIIDIVNLYRKDYLNINFEEVLSRYMKRFPLLDSERELLFILITLPPIINLEGSEYKKCKELSKNLDYIYKTENLIRPYYAKEEK